jgi:hypothetical protein
MIRCDAQYNTKYWRLLKLNEKDIQSNTWYTTVIL